MAKALILGGFWLAASCFAMAHAQNGGPPDGPVHHKQAPRTRGEVEARVRDQFARFDANKDGVLTADELRPHRPSEAERQAMRDRMFAAMDKNGDGQISKAEFDAFHAGRMHDRVAGRAPVQAEADAHPGMHHAGMHRLHDRHTMMARFMLAHADADHDGKVTLAEAEKAALDRFDKIDTNHDGVISDAERDAARQQMAARFRERRAHWMEHKGDVSPLSPAGQPQG